MQSLIFYILAISVFMSFDKLCKCYCTAHIYSVVVLVSALVHLILLYTIIQRNAGLKFLDHVCIKKKRDRKRSEASCTLYKTIISGPRESFSSLRGVKATYLGGEKITN